MKNFFARLFAAIKTRHFLKHFGFAVLTLFILVFGIKWFLQSYTHHSDSYRVAVPNLVGLTVNQVKETLKPLELEFEIPDTVFAGKGARGTILLQHPGPTTQTRQYVKKGRMISLTIISDKPKMITIPKLKDKSRRHAEGVLKIIGIKANVKYKASSICNDCVLEQIYKGKALGEGAKVPKGETITLVLGQQSGEQVTVVNLVGLTIEQAQDRLSNSSLTMFMSCDCKTKRDSASAVIYRQNPSAGADVGAGSEINVWLSPDKNLLNENDH